MHTLNILSLACCLAFQTAKDPYTRVDLGDGFVKLKTSGYTIELPKEWTVGELMPWGARSITPSPKSPTELGVMTAGVTKQSWAELYKTSLFFVMRQEPGKATPYKVTKMANGYEACSFQVTNDKGFAKRRYVLLKSPKGEAIALSVIIADPKDEKKIAGYFDRMVRTAHIGS
jgi:hypothetical protein